MQPPHLLVYVSLLLLSCLMRLQAQDLRGNISDHRALLELKAKITSDQLGIMRQWNETVHFCKWPGVTCNAGSSQRVTSLVLQSFRLEGTLSPHIGNLSSLTFLDIRNNSFRFEIPQEIGRLSELRVLLASDNLLSGEIPPSLSNCSKLTNLYASRNLLAGNIPSELGKLLNLREILLDQNNLTGTIPYSFGNFSSLNILFLATNSLTGDIPESLGKLKSATFISAPANRISGVIPPSMFNLSKLTNLDFGLNQIKGSLPPDIGKTLHSLQVLALEENQFSGRIPASISNLTSLRLLQLGENKFTGNSPSLWRLNKLVGFFVEANQLGSGAQNDLDFVCSLVNATDLQSFLVGGNNFGGELPECIGNLSTNLTMITLDDNKFSGKIPATLGNLINLQWLNMSRNQFSGPIPSVIGNLRSLQFLSLEHNQLSGAIPSVVGELKLLTKLSLRENNLQGSIPPSIGNCKDLIELDLSRNNLNGSIPAELFALSSLSIRLDLSRNRLTGVLSSEIGNMKNLAVLDVADNLFTGEIPSSLSSCTSLETLNISNNLFEGTVPSSLNSLAGIQELNISHNKFTGEIPKVLLDFRALKLLDLSYNDFEGVVPTEGIFMNSSNMISVEGNKKLCGEISELQLPRCSSNKSKKKFSSSLRIAVSIVSALLGVAVLAFVLLFHRLRRKRKESKSEKLGSPFMEISYQTLLKATNGFSSENLMGAGGFGSVYKGILNEGKEIIAVKVLNLHRKGASKSFIAECEALRVIRHRNLVKILTICSGVDYKGNDFKALIYEFMSNGSLEEWLHPDSKHYDSNQELRSLNLFQRLSIALDVACALDYLHHQCHTPIVHCDLKPSNVLLDGDMTAHVGDFGLVRFLPEIALGKSLRTEESSIGIRGTVGYTAPEYAMGSEISTDGDLYSYGILLLEMFTGKRPTNEMFKEGLDLHKFAKGAMPEQVLQIVDPVLLHEDEQKSMNSTSQQVQGCLISVIGIGVACSAEFPRERMNIGDVVAQLSSLKDKLLGVRINGRLR